MSEPSDEASFSELDATLGRADATKMGTSLGGVILCIPAQNKQLDIGKVVSSAIPLFRKVIVCDDGSVDETAAVAGRAGALVFRHEESMGKGNTLFDLMEAAAADEPEVVVIMELDGRNSISEIPELVAPIFGGSADISTVVRETERSRARSAEFVAMNPRGLAVRQRDDFVSFVSEGNTPGLAAAAQLRFVMVTPRDPVLMPFPTKDSGRRVTSFDPTRWAGLLLHKGLMEKPFMFIGLPGIELSVSGIALLLYASVGQGSSESPSVPMSIVGAVALVFGITFMAMCAVIVSIRYSMGADAQGESSSPDSAVKPREGSLKTDSSI